MMTIEELALITAATEGETQPAIRFTDSSSVLLRAMSRHAPRNHGE
jgi:hypothetical protein